MSFHRRCGNRIHLSNLNRTARRNINDFNHGLVLSAEPMVDGVWFQVQIDEKVAAWNGKCAEQIKSCGQYNQPGPINEWQKQFNYFKCNAGIERKFSPNFKTPQLIEPMGKMVRRLVKLFLIDFN